MTARHSALIRRKRLGAEMRRIRKQAGLTGAEIAKLLSWSESKVSRVETARIGLSMADARAFAEGLELVGDRLTNYLALAEDAANTRGWWHAYRSVITTEQRMVADVEAGASRIRQYASVMLPGLVHTPDYARASLGWSTDLGVGETDVDTAVRIRMERQRVLTGRDPLHYDVLIDEAVVRREIAAPGVIAGQATHLLTLSELDHVRLRILPLRTVDGSARPPCSHGFQLIEFRDPDDPPVVSVESLIDLRYFTDRQHIDTYGVLFDRSWRLALDEKETAAWLATANGELRMR